MVWIPAVTTQGMEIGTLENALISGHAAEGFSAITRDGKPLKMALLDNSGNVIESGDAVAAEAWNVAIMTYRNFRIGQGHLRVYLEAPPNAIKLR